MKKERKKSPGAAITCSICGLPDPDHPEFRKMDIVDHETGETRTEVYEVHCLDHEGIHPSMWNLHPLFDKYRRAEVRRTNRKQVA